MYVRRELEGKLSAYLRQFKVVLVTGPRQAGKTTMLRHALPQRKTAAGGAFLCKE